MSAEQVPSGWSTATIETVCIDTEQVKPEHDKEFTYIDISSIDRFRKLITSPQRISGSDAPSRARKLVKEGDILVALTRPNLNAVAMIPADLDGEIASTGFEVLRPHGIEARWLYYFVRTAEFIEAMSQLVQGALYPAVRGKDVLSTPIPIAPINEQRRIADKLDRVLARVDTANEHLSRAAPLIKRFRQSVLAAATSGRLTEDTSTTSRQVMLQDVALDFSYGSSEKSKPHGKVPVLRMGNIQGGSIDWSDLVFTDNESEIAKYELTYGDVLFNRTNSPELVGKTAIYDQGPRAIYAGYLIRIKCTEELNPFYLNYCLNSPMGRAYCWSVKSDGVSQSNINAKKLAAFSFRLPSIEEQSEIVRRVEKLFAFADRLEKRLSQAQAAVQKLTPALLAKAFRGELVPQDPNDEPASELLKRLQESRTESTKPSRARKPRVRKSS
ncbi:MAG: restriction endonuclease subunit S [Lautropia mirabilis]|nr:restriction endonuclease subunit S [Lautropia mirabilis]